MAYPQFHGGIAAYDHGSVDMVVRFYMRDKSGQAGGVPTEDQTEESVGDDGAWLTEPMVAHRCTLTSYSRVIGDMLECHSDDRTVPTVHIAADSQREALVGTAVLRSMYAPNHLYDFMRDQARGWQVEMLLLARYLSDFFAYDEGIDRVDVLLDDLLKDDGSYMSASDAKFVLLQYEDATARFGWPLRESMHARLVKQALQAACRECCTDDDLKGVLKRRLSDAEAVLFSCNLLQVFRNISSSEAVISVIKSMTSKKADETIVMLLDAWASVSTARAAECRSSFSAYVDRIAGRLNPVYANMLRDLELEWLDRKMLWGKRGKRQREEDEKQEGQEIVVIGHYPPREAEQQMYIDGYVIDVTVSVLTHKVSICLTSPWTRMLRDASLGAYKVKCTSDAGVVLFERTVTAANGKYVEVAALPVPALGSMAGTRITIARAQVPVPRSQRSSALNIG